MEGVMVRDGAKWGTRVRVAESGINNDRKERQLGVPSVGCR